MDTTEAYQTLKNSIELDEDTQDAYDTAVFNQSDYRIVVEEECSKIKSSIEVGQSMIALGELVRQFYNATHREINGEIIDLPGAEFCQDVGKVANKLLEETIQINRMTEEIAITRLSCDDTVDISYA